MVTSSPWSSPASAASTTFFRRHDDRCGQVLPRQAGDFPNVGRGRGRQHPLDADAFIGELVLQRMAERNDEGLGRPVDAVERLGGDAHHRRDVDSGLLIATVLLL